MRRLVLSAALALSACSAEDDLSQTNYQTSAQALGLGTYNFGTLVSPGKCLDVNGGSSANGAKVQSWTCVGSGAQSFRVDDLGGGVARLVNTVTGKCLDAADMGKGDGTRIQQWDCSGGANQNFRIEDAGGGNVHIVGVDSNKCLDVANSRTADGTQVQLWTCNGTNAQAWRPASITLAGGSYNFGVLSSPGKCLDLQAASAVDGANIQQWTCNGSGAQSFRVEGLGGGAVRLVNNTTNKCVDVVGNRSADGTNIHQWPCNGGSAQSFRLEEAGQGNVRIVSTSSNKCVDVAGGASADGTNVQLWSCNGANAQLWRPALLVVGVQQPGQGDGGGGGGGQGGGGGGGGGQGGGGQWPPLAPRGDGVWVRVRNSCPFPIWLHGAGSTGALQPDDARLGTGESRDYVAPKEWSAARVTAFVTGPRQGEIEKGEFTFGGGVLNYNVTYVDWVGLPLEIVGVGGDCSAAQHTTGCYARQSEILSGCPEGFLMQGMKCLSARSYCLDPNNQGSGYCHALDDAIRACPWCTRASTPEVYACSGAYAQDPRGCAALNRGMASDPDNANPGLYYRNGPYNTYSKWVHQVCPDIYGFSYDDWLSHGGFRSCRGDEVRVTFCPAG